MLETANGAARRLKIISNYVFECERYYIISVLISQQIKERDNSREVVISPRKQQRSGDFSYKIAEKWLFLL